MFGLGIGELAIILVIVVILFGAGKLPMIGQGIGRGIKNFKKEITDGKDQKNSDDDFPSEKKQIPAQSKKSDSDDTDEKV